MNGKKSFAEEYEIVEATATADINGAIRAASAHAGDPCSARREASRLCPAGGIVVRRNDDGTFQVKGGDYHSVTVASTRAGKTRRVIVPMLESIILSDESNLIVNDPKGELLEATRDLLDLLGFEVVSLDFRHPERSSGRFNPLASAWDLWQQGRKDEAVNQLYDFATLINLDFSQKTDDAYWPNASINLFVGIALLLLEAGASREEFNMSSISAAEAHGAKDGFDGFRKLCEFHRDGRSYEFLSEAAFAPRDTSASIRSVFRASIARFVGRDALAAMMSDTTCPPEAFLTKRIALFVHTPDEEASLSPVVVGMVGQLLSSLISLARDLPGRRLPRRVDVVLDEFGNLRARMKDFDMMLSAACGHGIRLHLVMQSFAQFDYVYGKEIREIALDNIEQWVYLGSRSLQTNEYFSSLLGKVKRPPSYTAEPLMDVATLQRLERRADESEAVMLVGSLRPFVSALPDLSLFETPAKAAAPVGEAPVAEVPAATYGTFDLEAYLKKRTLERYEEQAARLRARQERKRPRTPKPRLRDYLGIEDDDDEDIDLSAFLEITEEENGGDKPDA